MWLTGLPCSGKSTISRHLAELVQGRGRRTEILDGDAVRVHLSQGLGFSREHRDINVRRIAFVAQLLSRHDVVVIAAVVSPYAETRRAIRQQLGAFVEVYVRCSLEECERRDVKGMYARARAGELRSFTGIDDPYEQPEAAEVTVDTSCGGAIESARTILDALERRGYLTPLTPAEKRGRVAGVSETAMLSLSDLGVD